MVNPKLSFRVTFLCCNFNKKIKGGRVRNIYISSSSLEASTLVKEQEGAGYENGKPAIKA